MNKNEIVSIIDSEDYYYIQVGTSCLAQRKHQTNATDDPMTLEDRAMCGLADHYIEFPPKVPFWSKVYAYIWFFCYDMSRRLGGA